MPERVECRSHIYDNGDGRLGICLLFLTPTKWTFAKRRLLADGFTLRQNGDTEGTLLFDPANEKQARAAIPEAGIKYRKVLTEADRIARAEHLKRVRANQGGHFCPKNVTHARDGPAGHPVTSNAKNALFHH